MCTLFELLVNAIFVSHLFLGSVMLPLVCRMGTALCFSVCVGLVRGELSVKTKVCYLHGTRREGGAFKWRKLVLDTCAVRRRLGGCVVPQAREGRRVW